MNTGETLTPIKTDEDQPLTKKPLKENKLVFVGSDGWPVEGIISKPIKTFIRRLILTRKIMRYKTWLKRGGCEINFN